MSTMTLNTANVAVEISGSFAKDYAKHTASASFSILFDQDYTNGTGENAANEVVAYKGTLDKSGTATIDLGAAVDVGGYTVIFTQIKAIMIRNVTDVAGVSIQVGGAASNPISSLFADTSDKAIVANNGFTAWGTGDASGYAVTNNSADQLKLANASAIHRARYEVLVLGVVAEDVSSSSSSYSSESSSSESSSSDSSESSST